MNYLYLPFKTYKDDGSFSGTKERYEKKYGKDHVITRSHGWINRIRKPLKVIKATDKLVIMGHGGSDSEDSRGAIGVSQIKDGSRTFKARTHSDLAQQIKDEGLPLNHRVIKLLSCYAAGAWKIDADNQTFSKDAEEYFAQLLAKSLGLLGYRSIVVGGFPGTVGSTSDKKRVFFPVVNDSTGQYPLDGDGEYGTSTKGYARWFDATGGETVL